MKNILITSFLIVSVFIVGYNIIKSNNQIYKIDFYTTEYWPDTIIYHRYNFVTNDTDISIIKYQIPFQDKLMNCYTIKSSNSTIPDSVSLHGQDSIVVKGVRIKPLN